MHYDLQQKLYYGRAINKGHLLLELSTARPLLSGFFHPILSSSQPEPGERPLQRADRACPPPQNACPSWSQLRQLPVCHWARQRSEGSYRDCRQRGPFSSGDSGLRWCRAASVTAGCEGGPFGARPHWRGPSKSVWPAWAAWSRDEPLNPVPPVKRAQPSGGLSLLTPSFPGRNAGQEHRAQGLWPSGEGLRPRAPKTEDRTSRIRDGGTSICTEKQKRKQDNLLKGNEVGGGGRGRDRT